MKLNAKRIKKLKSQIKHYTIHYADEFSYAFRWNFDDKRRGTKFIYGINPYDAMRRYANKINRKLDWHDKEYHYYDVDDANIANVALVPDGIKKHSEIIWFKTWYSH